MLSLCLIHPMSWVYHNFVLYYMFSYLPLYLLYIATMKYFLISTMTDVANVTNTAAGKFLWKILRLLRQPGKVVLVGHFPYAEVCWLYADDTTADPNKRNR